LRQYLVYLAALVLVLPFVLPALWGFMASFSTNQQITLNSLALPDRLYFENYTFAWSEANIGEFVLNSVAVSTSSAVLIALCAISLGYALARLDFPGRRLVLAGVLAAIAMPVYAYIVPLSHLVRDLGLANTRVAVILTTTATFLAVPTLLMRSFFQTLPEEFADAARVEGANEWQVFRHIMIPLASPGMLTVLIFAFVWAWNDLLLPVVFLQSPDKFTIPYGIAALRPADFRQDYVSVFAGSMISTMPMILIYLFLMRRFIAGLMVGGSKG
jgi:N-acetylglucosamine transport system permease protein